MVASGYGAADRVSKAGDTMTGTLVLSAATPLQVTTGSPAAGKLLQSDASGNASWTASSVAAPLNAIANAWSAAYAPAWTATTTNPVIGNGTITGRYMQAGKLVVYTGRILMGSTTTFGSGNWLVSLPSAANSGTLNVGSALFYSASSANHAGICWLSDSATMIFTYAGGNEVSPTNPQTWAANDQLRWTIVYESV